MGTSKGTADVEYANHEEAEEAIKKLNNGKINDQVIQVQYSRSSFSKVRRGPLRRMGAARKIRRPTGGRMRGMMRGYSRRGRGRGRRGRGGRSSSRGRFIGGRRILKFKNSLGRSRRLK